MKSERLNGDDVIKRYNNINNPLLSTYHVPDTLPNTLHTLIH